MFYRQYLSLDRIEKPKSDDNIAHKSQFYVEQLSRVRHGHMVTLTQSNLALGNYIANICTKEKNAIRVSLHV